MEVSQEQQTMPGTPTPGRGCSLAFWSGVVFLSCAVLTLHRLEFSWWEISGFLCLFLFLAVLGVYAWVRWKMRHLQQFMKLVNAGNIDHAVALMEREMEDKGETADRLNLLATLYGTGKRWEEGLAVLDRSETYGELEPMAKSNRAIFLSKLGRDEEAIAILEVLVQEQPNEFLFQANYCTLLHETGRTSEAREQFKIVENLYESQPPARFPYEAQRREQILNDCRNAVLGEIIDVEPKEP